MQLHGVNLTITSNLFVINPKAANPLPSTYTEIQLKRNTTILLSPYLESCQNLTGLEQKFKFKKSPQIVNLLPAQKSTGIGV